MKGIAFHYLSSKVWGSTFLLTLFFATLSNFVLPQNFNVSVVGIQENDSVRVIVKKSSEELKQKWAHHKIGEGISRVEFQLSPGLWNISIDATGYTYPSSQNFNFPHITSATFELTPLLNENFTYRWRDDDSAVGHATQSYINEPSDVKILNHTISVPTNFSAIKLRAEYGVVLSDDIEPWSIEDAYRLYKMFSNLYQSFHEKESPNFITGENVLGVFRLTNKSVDEDLTIELMDGIKYATISREAFTYAEPQIALLDGIRGKFFSKRLFHAVVNFASNFAKDTKVIDRIARERYGFKFMSSTQETEELMGEDRSNFQAFYNSEKLEILAMIEELPEGFHKQKGLQYMVRRIDGQKNPQYPTAPAIAWTHLKAIEFMDTAFFSGDLNYTRRLILHEKAHFLWEYTFDKSLKDSWTEIGGWFLDPTSPSGWTTYNTSEFVSAYGHSENPNEDMAESIGDYLTNPNRLLNRSVRKYEFIRDRVMHGSRYVAQIRKDLTFTVYNLYPDYVLPGKVIGVDIEVMGKPNEDKQVRLEIQLNSENPQLDGASSAYARFTSSIGTLLDIRLKPKNGDIDNTLVGYQKMNQFVKSGYWNLKSLRIEDRVGNARYENTTTIGSKLYIENPEEDITPPKFNDDLQLELVEDYFTKRNRFDGFIDHDHGTFMQALKVSYSYTEKNDIVYGSIKRVKFPNTDTSESYSKQMTGKTINQSSQKKFEHFMVVPDYFPTGYYTITYGYTKDIAGNSSGVYFVDDIDDFYIDPSIQPPNKFKAVRDSIYIETKFPDTIKPELDINNIDITATPTNPENPDGETRVDIDFLARDLSDFSGKESGIYYVQLTLRDPQGGQHRYQTGNSTMNHPSLPNGSYQNEPVNNSEWKEYHFDFILPKGSPPGTWGLSAVTLEDLSGNMKRYSFVEYVRFDVIESEIVLEEPLRIEVIDKVINAKNVDAIDISISCSPCAGLGYVAAIYSRGGGGDVVRSEGTLDADTNLIQGLNTKGVLDGEINLTVQLIDQQSNIISTQTTQYTKDVVYPSAYYTRSNLQNTGFSNLDDWVIGIEFNDEDLGGAYELEIGYVALDAVFQFQEHQAISTFKGTLDQGVSLKNFSTENFENGVLYTSLMVSDPNGNEGQENRIEYFVKIDNQIKHYRTTDNDFDQDGMLNVKDEFPFQKHDKFQLSHVNYNIKIKSASCVGEKDGALDIRIENKGLNYKLTLSKDITYEFNSISGYSQTIANIEPGMYHLCFQVEGVENYNQCFDINVTEPAPLSVLSKVSSYGNKIFFNLDGSDQYTIEHNGRMYAYDTSKVEIDLVEGRNVFEVKTDKYCQGTYHREVFVGHDVEYFPNPTKDVFHLHIYGKDPLIDVFLYSLDGNLLSFSSKEIPSNRQLTVDLSIYPEGLYVVHLKGNTMDKTIKIIRQ
ncbi:MAG: T9SS type A sorting domain-containing protein [Flavobacteriaceae bacterium]|nr:T9SS type A sorting domain-containing protein [Flavobacteriaceae bacterium]MCY4267668.1 T9SS type A sorting domain-containing protein [Flavobacteriaceae bacterium]